MDVRGSHVVCDLKKNNPNPFSTITCCSCMLLLPCLNAASASIMHTVRQLCDIFFFFSLFLPYLCDICWTCRVFTGVTTGVFAPPSPPPSRPLCCSPCPHTMNTLASRLQNQLSRWEEGKSNLTAATRRGDCFSSQWRRSEPAVAPRLRFYWRGWKGEKLLGRSSWTSSLPQVKSHPFPPHFHPLPLSVSRHSLFHFPPHSSWHYLSVTRRHRGTCIPPSSPPDETEQ